jgi:hypothetical protein
MSLAMPSLLRFTGWIDATLTWRERSQIACFLLGLVLTFSAVIDFQFALDFQRGWGCANWGLILVLIAFNLEPRRIRH